MHHGPATTTRQRKRRDTRTSPATTRYRRISRPRTASRSLAHLVATNGRLDSVDAVRWTLRCARILERLHSASKTHGSLSASVVIIDSDKSGNRAVLRRALGKPAPLGWRSPEQLHGQRDAHRGDTWGIGVMLFYLLTAHMPYPGLSASAVWQQMCAGERPNLRAYGVDDEILQRVVDSLLEPQLDRRVTIIGPVRRALERWLASRETQRGRWIAASEVGVHDGRAQMPTGRFVSAEQRARAAHLAQSSGKAGERRRQSETPVITYVELTGPQASLHNLLAAVGNDSLDEEDLVTAQWTVPSEQLLAALG